MRVVIAGGSGLIGGAIARSLLADGHVVAILSRTPDRSRKRRNRGLEGAEFIAWTARADATLVATLAGADAIVNVAGEAIGPRPWILGRKRAIVDSRVDSADAIVEAIRRLPPDRRPRVIVSASGTDVYTGRDAEPAIESTPPAGGFLGELGLVWEGASAPARSLGTRVVAVRTAFVLGRDAPLFSLLRMPFRFFLGGRLGSGRQWFSWIHLDDLVGIYRLAIEDARLDGPVNAASPEPVRQAEFARALGRAMGRPAWFPVPEVLLRLVLREQATLIVDSRRVVPARALELGYRFRFPALDAALADLVG